MNIKQQLINAIQIDGLTLEHPDVEDFGDFSTNIALQQKGGRPLAEKIAHNIQALPLVKSVEVAGPGFINISLQIDALISEVKRVITTGDDYGKQIVGTGKTVVVDYSAPNIAKRFGIGHLRSTIIGQALYNLYNYLGYTTIGDNHLGDWGTQFGKLLYMIDTEQVTDFTVDNLERLYVEFHALAHDNPKLEEEGRKWFKRLEDGDARARELWEQCIAVSMREFDEIYSLLGVSIDFAYGESFYEDKMQRIIDDARSKQLAISSDGALVLEVLRQKAPLMLLKSDGATTYATRDLATIQFRMETWNPSIMIYEVGNEQSLHFEQVFEAAKLLGYLPTEVKAVHTKHGLYLNPDGKKFSTRKGDTVKLREVLNEAVEKAKQLGSGDEKTAQAVGIGAIKYFDLSHNVQSDIIFDWDKIMALDGNSGPYLQYTHARIHSVIEKSGLDIVALQDTVGNFESLTPEEMKLLRYVYRFGEAVEEAAVRFSPNLLTNYLYELASRYNAFYNQHSILSAANSEVKNFRLVLSAAVGQVIRNGLRILGITALEQM